MKLLVFLVCFCAELRRHAECLELEELTAMSVNPSLLPTLNDLLLEVYTMLRPKPIDYEQRSSLVDVFNKMANEIFGKRHNIHFLLTWLLNIIMNSYSFQFYPYNHF